MVTSTQDYSIGILDIYGFEIFEKNGFEQVWNDNESLSLSLSLCDAINEKLMFCFLFFLTHSFASTS